MKKETSVYVPIRLSVDIDERLTKLAIQKSKSKSQLIREFIDKGLSINSWEENEAEMLLMIRKALAMELEKPVERLATITAKGTQISSASYFMLVQTIRLLTAEDEQQNVDRLANQARRLGNEYLKSKNESIDNFIENGIKRMKT